MDDEVLAAGAALVGVPLAGEDERLFDQLAVDLLGGVARVLLYDSEQVAEQDALVLGELGLRAGGRGAGVRVYGVVLEVALLDGDLGLDRPAAVACGLCLLYTSPSPRDRS